MSDTEFRKLIADTLTCRIDAKYARGTSHAWLVLLALWTRTSSPGCLPLGCRARCQDSTAKFLQRCFYCAGPYDAPDGYTQLNTRVTEAEAKAGKVGRTTAAVCARMRMWPQRIRALRVPSSLRAQTAFAHPAHAVWAPLPAVGCQPHVLPVHPPKRVCPSGRGRS